MKTYSYIFNIRISPPIDIIHSLKYIDFRLKSQVKANCLPVSHSLETGSLVLILSGCSCFSYVELLKHAMCKTELGGIQVTSQVQFEYGHAIIHSLLWMMIDHLTPHWAIWTHGVFSWFRHIWGFALYRSLLPAKLWPAAPFAQAPDLSSNSWRFKSIWWSL